MKNLGKTVYSLALGCLATHELDAMTHAEWSLLFPFLDDELGRVVFVLMHIPLFFVIFKFLGSDKIDTRGKFRRYSAYFMIIHGLAHFLFSIFHSDYRFTFPMDAITIYGSAIFSGIYFLRLKLFNFERTWNKNGNNFDGVRIFDGKIVWFHENENSHLATAAHQSFESFLESGPKISSVPQEIVDELKSHLIG